MQDEYHMSFVQRFFMLFGIVSFFLFALCVAGGVYLYQKDPLGLKPLLFPVKNETTTMVSTSTTQSNTSVEEGSIASMLTPEQQKLLGIAGIDVATLPKEVTPALKACAEESLGKERLTALKSGAQPTLTDLLNAKKCLK